jgi:hypothetical protein
MTLQRPPNALPGRDPLRAYKFLPVGLFVAVVFLLRTATAIALELGSRQGHSSWPLAQWALTTPLGTVVLAVVGGLMWSVPTAVLIARLNPVLVRPVDVTALPLGAWPRSLSRWDNPTDATEADDWLGRTQSQRAQSWLALALAALLALSLLAAVGVSAWYGVNQHYLVCEAGGCPPDFSLQFTFPQAGVGVFIVFLCYVIRLAWVQRRCGVWFRARYPDERSLGTYIRRPGVTPEAAATALQRYVHDSRPLAQVVLRASIALIPFFLLVIGGEFLATWLSTQWIPG